MILFLKGGEPKHIARDRIKNCIKNVLTNTEYSTIGIASLLLF